MKWRHYLTVLLIAVWTSIAVSYLWPVDDSFYSFLRGNAIGFAVLWITRPWWRND